jgi:RNA polymerase sigma factor (sigma-70 family)
VYVTPLSELVQLAASGEQNAWNEIVARYEGLVWATARSHRLSRADAADVAQTVWLRLVENLDRIRDPERLGGWLATTARRECIRYLRLTKRELPSEEADLDAVAEGEALDAGLLTEARDAALWQAFSRLSARCQALLRLLASQEEPSYEEVGEALEMPIGAIGPTRMRCLEKLRSIIGTDPLLQGGFA